MTYNPRMRPLLQLLSTLSLGLPAMALAAEVGHYGYRVVHVYPHARDAFTEGLFYQDGYLYESTGQQGASQIRKVDLASGKILQRQRLPAAYFGEGIVAWQDRLIQLTWRSGTGFIYDLARFQQQGRFHYPGQGWALTTDGKQLIMSDGSAQLRLLDPATLQETSRLKVSLNGQPLSQLNELEWVQGKIYANVWLSSQIVQIDPHDGHVSGVIDLAGLLPTSVRLDDPDNDVLNGIAYDAVQDRLFVTGKHWPYLYQIQLIKTD